VEQTASGKRRVDHRGNWRPKVACLVFFGTQPAYSCIRFRQPTQYAHPLLVYSLLPVAAPASCSARETELVVESSIIVLTI